MQVFQKERKSGLYRNWEKFLEERKVILSVALHISKCQRDDEERSVISPKNESLWLKSHLINCAILAPLHGQQNCPQMK